MRAIDKLRRSGIRRLGTPASGFRWVGPGGRPLRGADLERVRALKLPPAWREVHVSPRAGAKLQAVGRDGAGRWQYRYHPDFVRKRSEAKYRRLARIAAALPRIRERVDRDLRRKGPCRERVLAAMIRILETSFIRPGSEKYAVQNKSYGLTTLRPRHVRVAGDRIVFEFRGKSGQLQVREREDARVAKVVRELLRVPGRDVFKFVEGGVVVDVRRRHLNAYIREVAGAPFTAKDFRTWAGTVLCASELARRAASHAHARGRAPPRKKLATEAVKAVADRLGNTPAVARASYVNPVVLDAFDRGEVIGCCFEPDEIGVAVTRGLHRVEDALLELLEARSRRGPALRVVKGGGRGAPPRNARPTAATAKPLGRAARSAER